MKTLKAFWHWVDNDKPTRITREHLSKTATVALCIAESQVAARAFGAASYLEWDQLWQLCSSADGTNPSARPEWFRPELIAAVRDLSLAVCPALEAMEAAVAEAPPAPEPEPMFRREYLSEWLPPTNTFFGVDRGSRGDRLLTGPRGPKGNRIDFARELVASGKVTLHHMAPLPAVDPRPRCVECGNLWTPAEGEDATRDACTRCVSWPRPYRMQQALNQQGANDLAQQMVQSTLGTSHPEPACPCRSCREVREQQAYGGFQEGPFRSRRF